MGQHGSKLGRWGGEGGTAATVGQKWREWGGLELHRVQCVYEREVGNMRSWVVCSQGLLIGPKVLREATAPGKTCPADI